jgi:HSP20 family protein
MARTRGEKKSNEIEPKETKPVVYRPLDEVFDDFSRSFEELMRPWFEIVPSRRILELGPVTRFPKLDLADNGDSYTVTAELPGLSKDQVNLNITKDGLEIRGEVKEEKEEKEKNYLHRERSYTSFRRYVAFPDEVLPEKAEADISKGILTLKVPKKEPTPVEEPVKVDIKEK